jgi:hypothetical protein
MKRLVVCLAAVAAAAALAGCGSSSHTASPGHRHSSSTTTPSSTTTASSSTTTSSTTSTSSTASTTSTTTASTTRCLSSDLSLALGQPQGTAGSVVYQLELTNSSNKTCVVEGYPGVSLVAGSNLHQVGAAARRVPGATSPVVLAPGEAAWSELAVEIAGNYPASKCQPTTASAFKVYPPNSYTALILRRTEVGCANPSTVILSVSPLRRAGTSA